MINAKTITTEQIRALWAEAHAAGDRLLAAWCDIALAPYEHADAEGAPLVAPDGEPTTRTMARVICADVIDAAAAQCDDAHNYQYRDDDDDPRYALAD